VHTRSRITFPASVLLAAAVALAACGAPSALLATATPTPRASQEGPPAILTPAPRVPGDPARGRVLMTSKGCAGCHTAAGVGAARGVAGPVLTNVVLRPTIAGEIPTSPENLVRWLLDPPAIKPGTAMPRLGLTEEEARDLAASMYSQPYNPGR
jgi:cytochrome c1